LHCKKKKA